MNTCIRRDFTIVFFAMKLNYSQILDGTLQNFKVINKYFQRIAVLTKNALDLFEYLEDLVYQFL